MTVTAPIVNGELVWKVAYHELDIPTKLCYSSPDAVAALIDRSTLGYPDQRVQLEVRCDNDRGKKAVVARRRVEDYVSAEERQSIIDKAVKVLATK
jgi:hypothetical protein